MLLKATSKAPYSLLPPAKSFHTSTIAIQRAKPIRINPIIYSGLSERKNIAKPDIKIGPMIQLRIKDNDMLVRSLKISGKASNYTFANGGYIIKMSPRAIGIFVEPMESVSIKSGRPGKRFPRAIPMNIAANIHNVKKRSRKESLFFISSNY